MSTPCQTAPDPDVMFYPGKGQDYPDAAPLCDACPLTGVGGPCVTAALEHEGPSGVRFRFGMWGGTTPYQRWKLAGKPRPAAFTEEDQ